MIYRKKSSFACTISLLLFSQLIAGCSSGFFSNIASSWRSTPPPSAPPPPPTPLPHQTAVKPASAMPSWDYGELPRPRVVEKTSALPHVNSTNTTLAQNSKSKQEAQDIQSTPKVLVAPVTEAVKPAPVDIEPITLADAKAVSPAIATASIKKFVTFRQGSFKPTWSQLALMRELAAQASKAPEVKIVSRADTVKTDGKDKRLAMNRAAAVKWALMRAGVSEDRIAIVACKNCTFEQELISQSSKQVIAVSIEFDQVERDRVASLANLGNAQ